jgi:hypothetical protein
MVHPLLLLLPYCRLTALHIKSSLLLDPLSFLSIHSLFSFPPLLPLPFLSFYSLAIEEKHVAGQEQLQKKMINFKKILATGIDLFNSNCIPAAEAIWQVFYLMFI